MTAAPHLEDVATLAKSALLGSLADADLGILLAHLEVDGAAAGAALQRRGEPAEALTFVLEGRARVERVEAVGELAAGDCYGVAGFAARDRHVETVTALSATRVARLTRTRLAALSQAHPAVALHLLESLLAHVGRDLVTPSALAAGARPAREALPETVDGAMVVAARVPQGAVSLHALLPAGAAVEPVTTRSGEGREVFRRSAGLALLEAARRAGLASLQIGPSITSGRVVLVEGEDRAALAARLDRELRAVIDDDLAFDTESEAVERAIERFGAQGWEEAAALLESASQPSVELLRCGEVRALGPGPLLPSTSMLRGVQVLPHPQGLLLDFGASIRSVLSPRPYSTVAMEMTTPRYGAPMTRSQAEWLELLGVRSVGHFNRACISGQVRELILVSEGFHEKHIAQIADAIKARQRVRIVAVAGPSASGKTTFIKRLRIQLEVNGIHPLGLSLDDYYRDREMVPRDASGEHDLEALHALDLALLDEQVGRLLAGERVTTARYDFRTGKSQPAGGLELSLGADQVLLLEGIHALHPQLLSESASETMVRVFVHPGTSLPFDRLTRLEPSDVRLLRRIVRDRHQRGFAASDNLSRWESVRRGERLGIYPFQGNADWVFDSSLVYEPSVLRVYAERYLLEVPRSHPTFLAAHRLRRLLESFVPIHPDSVPPTSLLREFIGGSALFHG